MKAALVLAALVSASLPGAAAHAQAGREDALPSTQRGIAFAKDPSGAIITKIAKESAAERAGITEGMVITHIDGLPLRELTTAQIARLFAGARLRIELKIRGAGTVTVSDAAGGDSAAFKLGKPDY